MHTPACAFLKDGNIEHPTLNIQHPMTKLRPATGHWMFDVGCWVLDVPPTNSEIASHDQPAAL